MPNKTFSLKELMAKQEPCPAAEQPYQPVPFQGIPSPCCLRAYNGSYKVCNIPSWQHPHVYLDCDVKVVPPAPFLRGATCCIDQHAGEHQTWMQGSRSFHTWFPIDYLMIFPQPMFLDGCRGSSTLTALGRHPTSREQTGRNLFSSVEPFPNIPWICSVIKPLGAWKYSFGVKVMPEKHYSTVISFSWTSCVPCWFLFLNFPNLFQALFKEAETFPGHPTERRNSKCRFPGKLSSSPHCRNDPRAPTGGGQKSLLICMGCTSAAAPKADPLYWHFQLKLWPLAVLLIPSPTQ